MRENKILSKTFVLGEYAILHGGPSILLVSPPKFRLKIAGKPSSSCPFHPSSPAGLLWQAESKLHNYTFSFEDPHHGRGGFGGSGAEFVSLFLTLYPKANPKDLAWQCWERFRELSSGIGSGADILAQCFSANQKSAQLLYIDIFNRRLEDLPLFSDAVFFCLRTGIKMPTHEHLKEGKTVPVQELSTLVKQGKNAIRENNAAALGNILERYATLLDDASCLAPHSKEHIEAIHSVPGIFGVKACGALGADVILVLAPEKARSQIKSVCEKRNLELVPTL